MTALTIEPGKYEILEYLESKSIGLIENDLKLITQFTEIVSTVNAVLKSKGESLIEGSVTDIINLVTASRQQIIENLRVKDTIGHGLKGQLTPATAIAYCLLVKQLMEVCQDEDVVKLNRKTDAHFALEDLLLDHVYTTRGNDESRLVHESAWRSIGFEGHLFILSQGPILRGSPDIYLPAEEVILSADSSQVEKLSREIRTKPFLAGGLKSLVSIVCFSPTQRTKNPEVQAKLLEILRATGFEQDANFLKLFFEIDQSRDLPITDVLTEKCQHLMHLLDSSLKLIDKVSFLHTVHELYPSTHRDHRPTTVRDVIRMIASHQVRKMVA